MRRYRRCLLLSAALAAVLATSGCELLAAPIPGPPPEDTIGVEPSGVNIDTTTVPPEGPADPFYAPPPVASAPKTQPSQPSGSGSDKDDEEAGKPAARSPRAGSDGKIPRHHTLRDAGRSSGSGGSGDED